MRKSFLFLSVILGLVCGLLVLPLSRADGAPRNPVIFVHGLSGAAFNFGPMMHDFTADGYAAGELRAFSYDFAQSNRQSAEVLRDQVDDVLRATGAQRVDIVAHSMGGLVTRWYLKFLGGTDKVDHFVSFGSPHHGTVVAGLCSLVLTSCKEMQRNSDLLNELNSGDETPGDVEYTTLTSSCDELVVPHSSSSLDGADNRNVGCVEHAFMLVSTTVSRAVRAALRN